MLKDFDLSNLVQPLTDWFRANARELPWREHPSPYYVWISEIMLQQTRVEAVKRYFDRFVTVLPDVAALAGCPEDTYLKLWEGLGYYSRVRNLHAAAVQIMGEYGGVIPEDYQTLLKLKGIGHYTAGAIASLAYEKPEPAVDGNVLRVITRVSGDDTDIMNPAFRNETEQSLRALLQSIWPESETQHPEADTPADVPSKELPERSTGPDGNYPEPVHPVSPRIFNQALMELGALVCVPNGEPHCGSCPWKEQCISHREGLTDVIPVKKKVKERRSEDRTVFLIRDGSTVAIRKRPAKGLLAGLYEFPNQPGHFTEKEALDYVRGIGFNPLRIRRLPDSVHIFSHVEWHMIAYQILVEEDAFATSQQKARAAEEGLIFVDAATQKELYAVPSAFAAYKAE